MENTHMPFLLNCDGRTRMFGCRKINGVWKLHENVDGDWRRIDTGLPDDAIECSPAADYDNGRLTISFIAGGAVGARLFMLYKMPDGEAPEPVAAADVGFVWEPRTVHAHRTGAISLIEPERDRTLLIPGAEYLYRVSYIPDAPDQLLISGKNADGIFSWLYNLRTGELFSALADGEPAYKTAFLGGKCWYAKRTGDGFEDREIVEAETVEFVALDPALAMLTDHAKTDACPDCLRKHLSAALSYAKEVLSGHGAGATPDHRADLAGELINAEHHAELLSEPFAAGLRDLRHRFDLVKWVPDSALVDDLRARWLDSLTLGCGCRH